jgi:hypothetical protein
VSKRFRDKDCAYCGNERAAETGDHVFAKEFFPKDLRADLPQVPSCVPCNNDKSKLEHYLLTVLPFGGNHPASHAILRESVPRRLEKNAKLHRELSSLSGRAWIEENGVVRNAATIPIEADKIVGLFRMIPRGLAAFHWKHQIPPAYHVGAGLLTKAGEEIIAPLLVGKARQRVVESLGAGLVEYQGAQALDDPSLTIWRFSLYGGVLLGGDPQASTEAPSCIWAISAREPLDEIFG